MTASPSRRRHVYGPVPSRRFGLSLGVDPVPRKRCPFDCVYCQLGPTPRTSVRRASFFPPEEILEDVREALERGPRPGVITLAGSGEPSLYAPLEGLLRDIQAITDIPTLLLTNGALLFQPDVAKAALQSRILVPSLDAADPETFRRINAPHASLSYETVLEGIRRVCAAHPGTVRLEIVLVPGVNDDPSHIDALAERVRTLDIDGVDLNTPVRAVPGARIGPCTREALEEAAARFHGDVRIVARYRAGATPPTGAGGSRERVLDYVDRRPGTVEDICTALGLHTHEVSKVLAQARADGRVRTQQRVGGTWFYGVQEPDTAPAGEE